ncbi:MAG: oxygen-independent coproporphyrinogen III oxidase [Proteobacteria bacterium]|nr:oxygen-independent coproporphyrinogen III oxidase [Pseudomonadota bacterium]
MSQDLLAKYGRRVPRYTSYPTAPQFAPKVRAADYRAWLGGLDPALPLSLYFHIPFCDSLCWFCGCHTKVVRRYAPIAAYLELLLGEMDRVADLLPGRHRVCHVHLGGGTPTILEPADMERLFARLRERFDLVPGADVAVENDPREFNPDLVETMARVGVTRASLGLQDVDPQVQRAVNRVQSMDETARVANALRGAGIASINIDLMYGLPYQTVARVLTTIEAVLDLGPERICLFGYAHVPWMKRHQRLIDEAALPGAAERFAQYMAAVTRLQEAGYAWVGLDHFARPDDALARAARDQTLHRNFQGYTTDPAPVRLGFGFSAIGSLPQGFVQNEVPMHAYRDALQAGGLPVARGLGLDDDDRLRGAVIERLMCFLEVDLDEVCRGFGAHPGVFADALPVLAGMAADGVVALDGARVRMTERGRPFVRTVCAAFDRYLEPGETRHAQAV